MNFTAFLCEYNPFHLGHLNHLIRSRAMGDPCVCVMSGCFVQRGEPAVADPWTRAEAALNCGCDAVLLLPAFYSLQPSEFFAAGAMTLIARLGAKTVTFGSPVTDTDLLKSIGALMQGEGFREALSAAISRGIPYPQALQEACTALAPDRENEIRQVLSSANATLGVEYLRALDKAGYGGDIRIIPRPEDSVSASYIRSLLHSDEREDFLTNRAEAYLPPVMKEALLSRSLPRMPGDLFAYLCRMHPDFSLPDDHEGIANRLIKAGRSCSDWDSLLDAAKTRRYTRARLQRAILHALLDIRSDSCDRLRRELPLYVYPLALNETGTRLIAQWKKENRVPVIDRPAAFVPETEAMRELWAIEQKTVEVYSLLDESLDPGALFTHPVIRR